MFPKMNYSVMRNLGGLDCLESWKRWPESMQASVLCLALDTLCISRFQVASLIWRLPHPRRPFYVMLLARYGWGLA